MRTTRGAVSGNKRTDDRIDDERLALKINGEMDRFRPKYEHFGGVYLLEEMRADQQEILDYQKKKNIIPAEERRKLKDGIMVEKILFDTETMDLLAEEIDDGFTYDTLLTGDEDQLLEVTPAHPYDDYFNNVDVICAATNAFTGHEKVPFAIDCTSNAAKVQEKMGYLRTREQVPGFTDVKYFHDTAKVGEPLPTGGLEKIPRFVVGFDAELAREMLEYDPEESNTWLKAEHEQRCDHARYYMLMELRAQAEGKDERLEKYFGGLLKNFVQSRGRKNVERYPRDAVFDQIMASARGQRVMEVA